MLQAVYYSRCNKCQLDSSPVSLGFFPNGAWNQFKQPSTRRRRLPNSYLSWMNFANDYASNVGVSLRYALRPFQPRNDDYSAVCVHGCPIAETLFSIILRLAFFASMSFLNILLQHYACTLSMSRIHLFLHNLPLWELTHGSVLNNTTVRPKSMPGCP